jgi:hypothetical protein
MGTEAGDERGESSRKVEEEVDGVGEDWVISTEWK